MLNVFDCEIVGGRGGYRLESFDQTICQQVPSAINGATSTTEMVSGKTSKKLTWLSRLSCLGTTVTGKSVVGKPPGLSVAASAADVQMVSAYCQQSASVRSQQPLLFPIEHRSRAAQMATEATFDGPKSGHFGNHIDRTLPQRPETYLPTANNNVYERSSLEQLANKSLFFGSVSRQVRDCHGTDLYTDPSSTAHRRRVLGTTKQRTSGNSCHNVESQQYLERDITRSGHRRSHFVKRRPAITELEEDLQLKRPRLLLQKNYDTVVISRSSTSRIFSVVETDEVLDFRLSETVTGGTSAIVRDQRRRRDRTAEPTALPLSLAPLGSHKNNRQRSGNTMDAETALESANPLVDSGYGGTMTTLVETTGRVHCRTAFDGDLATTRQLSELAEFESTAEKIAPSVRHNRDPHTAPAGQIRLSLSTDKENAITLTVQQLRLDSLSLASSSELFLQVRVIPSATAQNGCLKSRTLEHIKLTAGKSLHHKKLFLQTLPEDVTKRLLISLSVQQQSCAENMIGCLSFGIGRLISTRSKKRLDSGWFYLMPEEIGKERHVRVQRMHRDGEDKENVADPKKNFGIIDGIDRTGRISEISARNYSPNNGYVQRMRRDGECCYSRDRNVDECKKTPNGEERRPITSAHIPFSVLQHGTLQSASSGDGKNRLLGAIFRRNQHHLDADLQVKHTTANADIRQQQQRASLVHLQQGQYYKWNPDISLIPPTITREFSRSCQEKNTCSRPNSNAATDEEHDDDDADSGNASDAAAADAFERPTSGDLSWQQNGFIESDDSDVIEDVVQSTDVSLETGRDSLIYFSPTPGGLERSFERLPATTAAAAEADGRLEQAVKHLLNLETTFAVSMTEYIQQYSRPLRFAGLVSAEQHRCLFQNIEKLVRMSEYHANLLTSPHCDIGATYLPQVSALCDAYTEYLDGLDDSKRLLSILENDRHFQFFMQTFDGTNGEKTSNCLKNFLDQPAVHIIHLCEAINNVLVQTPRDNKDYDRIQKTADNLLRFCQEHDLNESVFSQLSDE